jgi:hypothetical protein
MTTSTPTSGVTFANAAAMFAGHLADHALPEPVSLSVTTSYGDSTVTAQLRGHTVSGVAGDLMAWADTLSLITVEAWRPPERNRVHLSIQGTLTGSAGAVELMVFGAVDYGPTGSPISSPTHVRGYPWPWDSCAPGRRTPRPPPTLRCSPSPGPNDDLDT